MKWILNHEPCEQEKGIFCVVMQKDPAGIHDLLKCFFFLPKTTMKCYVMAAGEKIKNVDLGEKN